MPGSDYGSFPMSDSVRKFSADEVVRSLRSQFEKSLTEHPIYIGEVLVSLTGSKTGQGGYRYWFICPACGTRVAKLYVQKPFVACRHCQGLKYPSSRYKGMVEEQIFKDGQSS